MSKKVVLAGACRTAIGTMGGSLSTTPAADLGANPALVFIKNILPQSLPGIISACMMTFMPTMSSYVISDTLSEGKLTLFGNYIYLNFTNSAWNDGSFMAMIMLIIVFISMIFSGSFSSKEERKGGGVW